MLEAVLAVAVYPGGAFLALSALLLGWARGAPRGRPLTLVQAAGLFAACVAAALAPLPGSPAAALPPAPAFGAPPNLVAALLLEAAAVALVTGGRWTRQDLVAAVSVLAPAFVLAAATATLSLPLLAMSPGSAAAAGKLLIGGAVLAAVPVLLRWAGGVAVPAVLASAVILATGVALGPQLQGLPAAVSPVVVLLVGAAYGALLRGLRRLRTPTPLTAVAALQGAAALVTILLARAG